MPQFLLLESLHGDYIYVTKDMLNQMTYEELQVHLHQRGKTTHHNDSIDLLRDVALEDFEANNPY